MRLSDQCRILEARFLGSERFLERPVQQPVELDLHLVTSCRGFDDVLPVRRDLRPPTIYLAGACRADRLAHLGQFQIGPSHLEILLLDSLEGLGAKDVEVGGSGCEGDIEAHGSPVVNARLLDLFLDRAVGPQRFRVDHLRE